MSKRNAVQMLTLLGFCVLGAPIVIGQKNAAQENQDAVVSDLLELRKTVGESVLSGTSLELTAKAQEEAFQASLRRAANETPIAIPAMPQRRPQIGDAPAPTQQTVTMLRQYSTRLDRIANDIEPLREYDNADALRETATALRLLARQFDERPPKRTPSTK